MIKNKILSLILKLFNYAENLNKSVKYEQYRSTYKIDSTFRFNRNNVLFYGKGEINIDSCSYIGIGSSINAIIVRKVQIEKNCCISHNVIIYSNSYIPVQDFNSCKSLIEYGAVGIIGNSVWIGANLIFNPGIVIGNSSIIRANSVVTKNIEPNAIYGGVLSKFLRNKNVS